MSSSLSSSRPAYYGLDMELDQVLKQCRTQIYGTAYFQGLFCLCKSTRCVKDTVDRGPLSRQGAVQCDTLASYHFSARNILDDLIHTVHYFDVPHMGHLLYVQLIKITPSDLLECCTCNQLRRIAKEIMQMSSATNNWTLKMQKKWIALVSTWTDAIQLDLREIKRDIEWDQKQKMLVRMKKDHVECWSELAGKLNFKTSSREEKATLAFAYQLPRPTKWNLNSIHLSTRLT